MIQKWFKQNKIAGVIIIVLLLCMALGWMAYSIYGRQLIKAMYEGRTIGILNMMIKGQVTYPVEYYYKKANTIISNSVKGIVILAIFLAFMPWKHLRQKLTSFLLLLFSLVLSLFLLEMGSRFYLFRWDNFSIEKIKSVRPIGISGLIQPSPYSEIVYELKPNLNAYFKLARIKTNSKGLRDKEYSINKPKNTFRVAVIGDSISMPGGVDIEDAYHTLLEDRLNKENRNVSYEFINFSVAGYNLRQYLGVMEHKAKKYAPDLILIGFAWNDCYVPPDEMFEKLFVPKRESHPLYESFALKLFRRVYRNKEILRRTNVAPTEDQMKYMEKMFAKMHEFSKKHNIPIVVIYLSIREKDSKPIESLIKRNKFFSFDAASSIRGSSDYRIYPIDDHPNAEAHKIFADRIYNFLIENKLLPKSGE